MQMRGPEKLNFVTQHVLIPGDHLMTDRGPLVSVIMPSMGRPSLRRAVESVLAQTYEEFEIIIRFDATGIPTAAESLPIDPRIRIFTSSEYEEISVSRARAVEDCRGDFVAFLDDDDRFRSTKLQQQVSAARKAIAEGAKHVVIGGRVAVYESSGRLLGIVPRRLPDNGEAIGSYLFRKREVRPGEASFGASMMLCDRDLLRLVPLGRPSSLHEDWEWVLLADGIEGTRISIIPEVVSEYVIQPSGASASTRSSWKVSEQWVTDHLGVLGNRASADFLLFNTLPLALAQGEWRAVPHLLARSWRVGPPGFAALGFVFLLILVPERLRRWIGNLLSRTEDRAHH
jgi:glycosyltransferase involved in cell wall biosynthesis